MVLLPLLLLFTAGAMGLNVMEVFAVYFAFKLVLRLFSREIISRNLARVFEDKNKRV